MGSTHNRHMIRYMQEWTHQTEYNISNMERNNITTRMKIGMCPINSL